MKRKKKRSVAARIFGTIGIVLLAIVVLLGGFIGFLTIAEYRPADTETVELEGTANGALKPGDSFRIVSWNIGYAALGEDADFFMDGGTMVRGLGKENVEANLKSIETTIDTLDPDILFLQEIDKGSSRSCYVKEYQSMTAHLSAYQSAFANNYKVAYVPYPMPPLGKVDSGVATYSKYASTDAQRVQLPIPFSWPVRAINLKRCLLVTRVPIADSDRELVLVNLHLEAYDDGEGKVAQTKMLASFLDAEAEKGNYVIAGGDFNQIFSSADQNAFPIKEGNWQAGEIDVEQFAGDWQFMMDETVPSCRLLNEPYKNADHTLFQYYLIDGFIVSANIRIDLLQTQDLGFVHSDHNPVLMEVTLLAD